MSIKKPYISVVVPSFNEQEVLEYTHKRLIDERSKINAKYEIIYISDGSTDRTNTLLDKFLYK